MATIDVGDREVRIRLTPSEKLFALRGDLSFPREAVESVEPFAQGMQGIRGVRAPGFGLPGLRAIGTWRRKGGKDLVVVKRGQPALRIVLQDQPWQAVLVGTDEPERDAAALAS